MEKRKKPLIPTSSEVRGWDILYRAHIGSTSDLVQLAVEMDMERELERSRAAESLGRLVMLKIRLNGYLTITDVEDCVRDFHYNEILNNEGIPDAD